MVFYSSTITMMHGPINIKKEIFVHSHTPFILEVVMMTAIIIIIIIIIIRFVKTILIIKQKYLS